MHRFCSLFLQLSLKVGVKVWLKCELFQTKFSQHKECHFVPILFQKESWQWKKLFTGKCSKFFCVKKQQTSMPDLFDSHVLILPENYKIITATKWLKQKIAIKMQGYHHSVCIHLLYTFLSNVLHNRRIKNKCLCIAQPDLCLQMQKIFCLIY